MQAQDIKQRIKQWWERLSTTRIDSSRSRSILLYLVFVVISALLWCFSTFNNDITIDMPIPVKVVSIPDNVRFVTNVPDTITVSVNDKGTAFVKYLFRSIPELKLNYADYATADGVFRVDATQLKKLIARQLSRGTAIRAIAPESIQAKFADGPGKKVPVVADVEVEPELLYTQNGPITKSVDSVTVYGDQTTLAGITEVYTYHIKATKLTDTLYRKVSIAPLRGAVVEPRSIELVVPIEKMISQRQKVQIAVRNTPPGVKVIVFPSSLEVSYRAPISAQKRKAELTVVVDYNAIDTKNSNKVAVQVGEAPAVFQDIKLSADSVEYIIEKHRQ